MHQLQSQVTALTCETQSKTRVSAFHKLNENCSTVDHNGIYNQPTIKSFSHSVKETLNQTSKYKQSTIQNNRINSNFNQQN